MKYEMYVKTVLMQPSKARTKAMIALGLFFLSGVILMFYSRRVAAAMLLPMAFLAYRIKMLSAERYQASDAKCTIEFLNQHFTIQLEPYSKQYSGVYCISYEDVSNIRVYNQSTFEISVSSYMLNNQNYAQPKVFSFSVSKDDYQKIKREVDLRFERNEQEAEITDNKTIPFPGSKDRGSE